MNKHTPGPWEVDLETGEINASGAVLGTVHRGDDFPCCEEDISEECKANAQLIAAAPDLFAACKEFVRKVECGEARSVRSYRQMKDAIAKAEGDPK